MKFPFEIVAKNVFDVVGFGTNAVDHLIRVPEYPVFNSKIELISHTEAVGGEVASSMVGLQKLGLKTAYVGRFGGDAAGELGRRSLEAIGVDITYCETVPEAQTQTAYIIVDDRNGERTVIWHRDAKLAYSANDAPTAAAPLGRILHITPHDAKACVRMATVARAENVIVSIDLDNIFDGIDELIPLVDVCIASEGFPEKLIGIADKRAALSEISARFDCPVVGLTLGASGSIILCGDSYIETKSFDVPGGCVDTTGAGDAFRVGFLFGMLAGSSVEEAADFANAAAALQCRGRGAREALPTRTELEAIVKKYRH